MPVGKIVDAFTFKRHGETFKVPVRLHKTAEPPAGRESKRYAGPQQTLSATFGVDIPELKINLWSTDIEALRGAVMDALADHYAIKWEEYWIVEVEESFRTWKGNSAGVELDWTYIQVGETPEGETVHRMESSRGRGQDIRKGWPNLKEMGARGTTRALVLASDANTECLEEFARRLGQLRGRMQEFLSPENIDKNLASLTSLITPELLAPVCGPMVCDPVPVEAKPVHVPAVSKKLLGSKEQRRKAPLSKRGKSGTLRKRK
jgi:hypothetical protein